MIRPGRALGIVPGNPLRVFVVAMLWFTAACVVATGVAYLLGVEPVWWIVPACLAASGVVGVGTAAFVSRPFVRDIEQIRERHLAHWTYAGDEWARFEEAEWQRQRRSLRVYPIFSLVLALVVGGIALASSRDPLISLGALGLFLAIGILVTAQTWGAARWRYARRHRAAGDVYISQYGILEPRGYHPVAGFNLRLKVAEVEPGAPATLRLQTESHTESATTRAAEFRVVIPYGREDEAREVAQQLLGFAAAR